MVGAECGLPPLQRLFMQSSASASRPAYQYALARLLMEVNVTRVVRADGLPA